MIPEMNTMVNRLGELVLATSGTVYQRQCPKQLSEPVFTDGIPELLIYYMEAILYNLCYIGYLLIIQV